ncbi:MAG: hypothetical protein U0587_15795 [Candidatus Binatia bacterium]
MDRRNPWDAVGLGLVAVFCAGVSLCYGLQDIVDGDDVYHLHAIWLVAQGVIPYREFFEVHPPGMWLVLAPFVAAFTTPSTYLLTARACVAIMTGAITWLAGRAIRANSLQALVLGACVCGITGYVQLWIFRAEYVAVVLVMAHLAMLMASLESPGGLVKPVLAAAALALACTISVRAVPFLVVQPLAMLLATPRTMWRHRALWRQCLAWLIGLAAGAAPAAIYLTAHHLWLDMWRWAFQFVSDPTVVDWNLRMERGDLALLLFGIASLAITARHPSLSTNRRAVMAIAWMAAVGFHLSNPHKIYFSAIYALLLTAALVATTAVHINSHEAPWRRSGALICVAVALLFYLRTIPWLPVPFSRQAQVRQLAVIDWLARVAGGEPVVLVAPYHPMLVRDASDIQNAWHYGRWILNDAVRARMRGIGVVLLRRPPVIAKDPEMAYTDNRDLVTWLAWNRVLTAQEFESVQSTLASEYTELSFPVVALGGVRRFGAAFWVRRDRLAATPPPKPYTVLRAD